MIEEGERDERDEQAGEGIMEDNEERDRKDEQEVREGFLDRGFSSYLLYLFWLFTAGLCLPPFYPPSTHLSDRQLLADSLCCCALRPWFNPSPSVPLSPSKYAFIFHFPPLSPLEFSAIHPVRKLQRSWEWVPWERQRRQCAVCSVAFIVGSVHVWAATD